MPTPSSLILGEFSRRLDERHRLSLPAELFGPLMAIDAPVAKSFETDADAAGEGGTAFDAILAKERPGALSLWNAAVWRQNLEAGIALVQAKMMAGKLEGRWDEVQSLGRLLSTRQRPVQIAGRGRLVIPEGFREFLNVPPGEEVLLVGAGVCVELWQPRAWHDHIAVAMPDFRSLFDRLTA